MIFVNSLSNLFALLIFHYLNSSVDFFYVKISLQQILESCSSMEEDDIKNKFGKPTVSPQEFKDENPTRPFDCTSQNCSPTRSSERVKSSSKVSKHHQGLDQFSKSPPYDCSRPKVK